MYGVADFSHGGRKQNTHLLEGQGENTHVDFHAHRDRQIHIQSGRIWLNLGLSLSLSTQQAAPKLAEAEAEWVGKLGTARKPMAIHGLASIMFNHFFQENMAMIWGKPY